jgi:nitrite reductase (NADH) small subunit
MRPTKQFDNQTWTLLDDLAEFAEGQGRHYEIDGHHYAAFLIDGQVRVYDNECPHESQPLAEGFIKDGCLTCPAHLWRWQIETGENAEPDLPDLPCYPTKQDGSIVYVLLP